MIISVIHLIKYIKMVLHQTQPANPTLKWETDKQTDIGIDAAFMKWCFNLYC